MTKLSSRGGKAPGAPSSEANWLLKKTEIYFSFWPMG